MLNKTEIRASIRSIKAYISKSKETKLPYETHEALLKHLEKKLGQ